VSVVAIVFALGAAVFLAVGFVVQQHAAAEQPPSDRLSFRLLVHLVRRPLWLGGIAAMVVGQLLGATALSHGSIALVDPIMAANLLFALPLAAVWYHRRLGLREWIGAATLIVGLALFIIVGDPHGEIAPRLPWTNWVIASGSVVLIVAVLVSVAKNLPAAREATLLATGAGLLYGLQDALTQRTLTGFSGGFGGAVLHILTTWPVYCLVSVAVIALLLGQSAFEAAPLPASLPATTVAEPVAGIAFGVGVFGEHLNLAPGLLVGEMVGLASMIAGVILLARSPIVSNEGAAGPTERGECGRAA
jgi:drug/metabolite transporter (DMT)-like permease